MAVLDEHATTSNHAVRLSADRLTRPLSVRDDQKIVSADKITDYAAWQFGHAGAASDVASAKHDRD